MPYQDPTKDVLSSEMLQDLETIQAVEHTDRATYYASVAVKSHSPVEDGPLSPDVCHRIDIPGPGSTKFRNYVVGNDGLCQCSKGYQPVRS